VQRFAAILGAGVVVVVVVVVIAVESGGASHDLLATFDSATQLVPGQQVRVAGRSVGELGNIKLRDGLAVVQLKITDNRVWPLPQGTRAIARWGSTSSYLWRFVELLPGPRSAPPLRNGALLRTSETSTPFELDQLWRVFRGSTHGQTGALVDELGATLNGRAQDLQLGLQAAPGGLHQTAAFVRQVGEDEYALSQLALAGNRTVTALATRDAQLGDLVDQAAGTFDELAAHTGAEQRALDRLPGALGQGKRTLARLDRSLGGLDTLVENLRPGAPALARMAGPAARALKELRRVAPLATSTLTAGTRAAPPLGDLFDVGTGFLPLLGNDLAGLTPTANCVRPYGPEIAGFFSTWDGAGKNYDSQGHRVRTFELNAIPAILPGTPFNSQQVTQTSPGIGYAFPRPPGMNVGQPWFLPQCGAGPSALDPAKDPEGAGAHG
jgi:virulence factor Mce-like protein